MPKLHLLSPKGFRAAGVACGIKQSGKPDLGLLVVDDDCKPTAAAAFTRNTVPSPGVTVGKEHIAGGKVRGFVVNSGNANACTGQRGRRDALTMCDAAADYLGISPPDVLPSSTGIIGEYLPMTNIKAGIANAAANLGTSAKHAAAFAEAILTTDLVTKTAAVTVKLTGGTVTLAGVCKGSGMIGPILEVADGEPAKQATMLAYLTTDAAVPAARLRKFLSPAVARTFNRTTIDNHASTNDTVAILASGASGVKLAASDAEKFEAALTDLCDQLAYQIAADGEGATKTVTVSVAGQKTERHAEQLARAIADSPLVKTAVHGNDPNWGRIICMAGTAAATFDLPFDADRAVLKLCGTPVFRNGRPTKFDAAALSKEMTGKAMTIDLACNLGTQSARVYTCDLSREYITINADYHT